MDLSARVLGDERRQRWLLIAVVGVGILCRLVQYAWRRSFWHDEAYLVLNIVDGHFGSVFQKLNHEQAAPPAFLWVQMAIVALMGASEFALRLFPLILGCANVALMAVLARRVASPLAALIATALFALSDASIWHCVESKQYSSDVFVALLLWLCATHRWSDATADSAALDRRRLVMMAAIATVAVWLSTPAVFAFGGISVAMLLANRAAFLRSARGVATYLIANALVAASFFSVYWLSLRQSRSDYLYDYWAAKMVPWDASLPKWLLVQAWSLFEYPFEKAGIFLLLFAIVAIVILQRSGGASRRLLWILVVPALLNLLAAALHQFPFAGTRVTLYLVPATLLLPAIGMAYAITRAQRARWPRLATAMTVAAPAAILLFGVVQAAHALFVPRHRGHIRPVAEFVQARREGDEKVYVLSESEPLQCYWHSDPTATRSIVEFDEVVPTDQITDEQFWVVYAYANDRGKRRPRAAVEALSKHAAIEAQFDAVGSSALHFVRRPTTLPSTAE